MLPRIVLGIVLSAVLVTRFAVAWAQGNAEEQPTFGTYSPGAGFRVAQTDQGQLNIKIYSYVRYLNQMGLDETYTDAFGNTVTLDRRQDIQLQKVNIQFYGWLMSPKLRYLFYVWTSNTSLGLGAQVVVGGNLKYVLSPHATFGFGIQALPGVRALEGNFPNWLTVDNRLLADEFFRPSYTTGIWAEGEILDNFNYIVMLGNNLSQLGVDAGQLDDGLNTVSGVVAWMPTTGEYGPAGAFGDYEEHEEVATRVAAHFSYSDENYQGQPTNDSFENVQIRLSNGGVIFQPDLFGPGIWVHDAVYKMATVDAGVKYRGMALEGEHYWRWVDDFRGPNTAGLANLYDTGFQLQASAMVLPQSLQAYVSGSKVFGEYGDPSDVRVGVNWFPWEKRFLRWNGEYIHLSHSPVGGSSLPYAVGGNGPVFYTSFEVNF